MIDLTLIGTGGGMPLPTRNLSATLIKYNGHNILLDCGEGTQVSMKMINSGFKKIDYICISHLHGDHIIGLPGLLSTIGNSGRDEPLTIIGPKGIKKAIEGMMIIINYLPYELNIIEDPNKDIQLYEDVTLNTLKLEHSAECLGYCFSIRRNPKFEVNKALDNGVPKNLWKKLQNGETCIEDGKIYEPSMVLGDNRKGIKISFTTDTRPIDAIIPFIEGSDLFICEGTYGDDEDIDKAIKNKHMTFREAATLALRGGVKKLLLTHFSESMKEPEIYTNNAKEVFNDVIIGRDRETYTINFYDD